MPATKAASADQADAVTSDLPPAPRLEPTHAERARTLVHATTVGHLATLAVEPEGYPFGSVVSYALDARGRPVLLLSDLAEHTRNVRRDERASLMATESADRAGDPLALGRVTLVGHLRPVPDAARSYYKNLYLAAHPATVYADFADFHFFTLDIAAVRYVGGFGHMSWVDADDYASAEPDPLHPHVVDILDHMNTDHRDALVAYSRYFASLPETSSAEMVGCDRYGFDVVAITGDDRRGVRIPFAGRTDSADEVRREMIRLLAEARQALG